VHRFGPHARLPRRGRLARRRLLAAVLPLMALGPEAKAMSCEDLQTRLIERRDLISALQALTADGKKLEPNAACTAFGKLATNGSDTLAWAEGNKDSCKLPDDFVQGLKAEHDRAVNMRERACALAAKLRAMPERDLSRGWLE
jgi:hypothetical protein